MTHSTEPRAGECEVVMTVDQRKTAITEAVTRMVEHASATHVEFNEHTARLALLLLSSAGYTVHKDGVQAW